MRKIITFLGTNIPVDRENNVKAKTSYVYNDERYEGYVFPQALMQFVEFDKMLVFLTSEAKESTWPVLAALNDSRIESIDIPIGETTAEMWGIFDQIIGQVNEGDSVIFDITHGLRSIPFLMFLFAAFLKSARGVTIEAVYYGAFELGDPLTGVPAPIFDLSEFINMLDWLTAANRFVETGDGHLLSEMLRDEMPPGLQMRTDLNVRKIGGHLKHSADEIDRISNALLMTRPVEVMSSGAKISATLQEANKTLEKEARPFMVLGEKIEQTYSRFGLENSLKTENIKHHLTKSIDLIEWYLNHQQASNACLLMREWMVSAVMTVLELLPLDIRKKRIFAENVLNEEANKLRNLEEEKYPDDSSKLNQLDSPLQFIKFWQKITSIRNDNAHCGYRRSAKSAGALIDDANNYYDEFKTIAVDILKLIR